MKNLGQENVSTREIRNCTVACAGGAGFLGSHLVDYLIEERNCNVIVLDNLISGYKKFVNPKAKFIWCDITHSEDELFRLFEKHRIEYIFQYCAEPYIPVSFERPKHVVDINFNGAFNVLQAGHRAGVKGILQVSSAEIYGSVDGKIKETDQANPHSTYGVTKLAIDHMVQVRWKEAGTPAIAMRQFNCVGERETHPYVIPEIISQIAQIPGKSGTVWLGNNSFRDFQYAGDAVKMAVELLEKGSFGEVYNMGSEDGILMYDLAVLIGQKMGKTIQVETDQGKVRPWEIWHLQSDNTKLYRTITSRPSVSLESALSKTIKYFNTNEQTWDF